MFTLGVDLKIGMYAVYSGRKTWANQQTQNVKMAYEICDKIKVKELCPDNSDVLKFVKKVMSSGLIFYHEQEDECKTLIQLLVGNHTVTSYHKIST